MAGRTDKPGHHGSFRGTIGFRMVMRRVTGTTLAAALLALPTLPAPANAECTPEVDGDAVTVESCPIEHTGYRLVVSRTTAAGTVGGAVLLLQEDAERAAGAGPAHRSILHEATGAGLSYRVVVSRRSWWRLDGGGVVLDIVGADDLATDLQGTRVLCLRSRWTITPADTAGMIAILQETVSDPRPPFSLTGLVTAETSRVMHEKLTDLRAQLASPEQPADPDLSSWPLLSEPLPDVAARFAACHLDR